MKPVSRTLFLARLTFVARPSVAQSEADLPVQTDDGAVSFRPLLVSQLRLTDRDREQRAVERDTDIARLRFLTPSGSPA